MRLLLDGPADTAKIEAMLEVTNAAFDGEQFNTAFAFGLSFLATLIALYEDAEDLRNQFDYDKLGRELSSAVEAAHES